PPDGRLATSVQVGAAASRSVERQTPRADATPPATTARPVVGVTSSKSEHGAAELFGMPAVTCTQSAPPSTVRQTPQLVRRPFTPDATATKTRLGSAGSTSTAAMVWRSNCA